MSDNEQPSASQQEPLTVEDIVQAAVRAIILHEQSKNVHAPPVPVNPLPINPEPKISNSELSAILPEFTGHDQDVVLWLQKIDSVKNVYLVENKIIKLVAVGKLTGIAKDWYHSKVEHITMEWDVFKEELKRIFSNRPDKIALRRKFEARTWKKSERFVDYFHNKIKLGNNAGISDSEMLDYVIDGFDDKILQSQARMQNFTSLEVLLQTMSSITERSADSKAVPSRKPVMSAASIGSRPTLRCFNCNKEGHVMAKCDKPARPKGSCFHCGKMDHKFNNCPTREQTTRQASTSGQGSSRNSITLMETNYSQPFMIQVTSQKLNDSFQAVIDTGSPVSLIQEGLVPSCFIKSHFNLSDCCLKGINNSKLLVKGIFEDDIIINDNVYKISFYVVAANTMSFNCLLGRDFIQNPDIKEIVFTDNDFKIINLVNHSVINNENLEDCEFPFKEIMLLENEFFNSNNDCSLDVEPSLTPCEIEKFKTVFNQDYLHSEKPSKPVFDFPMNLNVVKSLKPFNYRLRRLSFVEKQALKNIIDDLLDKGIIRESESPYCSPIVLIPKKSGDYRLCIDYRYLNSFVSKNNFPLPLPDDHLDRLKDKKVFTKLDLKNAYYHVSMDPDSVKYTAFVTPFGHFEFLKMPFGLSTSPPTFARYISKLFQKLIEAEKIFIYFDDMLIATKTFEENLTILKEVFRILSDNLLELRLDKCSFFKKSIDYLGYHINEEGLRPNNENLKAIANYPIPSDAKQVQRFIGLVSFFRRFVQNFSIIAKPLYDLLKKNTKFEFNQTHLQSFETLKQALISKPVLAIYSPYNETELHCDASSLGYAGILLQKQENNKFHPVFYYSSRTTDCESKYHSYELECLAIIYSLKRFHVYLHGLKFKIITDCDSFRLTLSKKDICPRIMRWCLFLQNYDYTIEHRSSAKMQHVDALSRIHNIFVLEGNTLEQTLAVKQTLDPDIIKVRDKLENREHPLFELRNGLVYRKQKDKILFYVPSDMVFKVIHFYHDNMGHFGLDKTYELISRTYWFPKMRRTIQDYISNCLKCIEFNPKSGKEEGLLHCIPKGNIPFETIHIDHYGPLNKTRYKQKYIFEIIDGFTKFIKFYSCNSTSSKEVIKHLLNYFHNYSYPKVIISDRGSCFTSKEFSDFVQQNDIKHILIASGVPRANGQIERINRLLTPLLSKITDEKQADWDRVLYDVEFCINNTVNRSTGETPAKLLFGVHQSGKFKDNLREILESINDGENNRAQDFEGIRTRAQHKIEDSQQVNKEYYDEKHKEAKRYKVGDYVMISNYDTTPGVSKKLIPKYRGPYQVSAVLPNDRYAVTDIVGYQNTQIPYDGVIAASRMKAYNAQG